MYRFVLLTIPIFVLCPLFCGCGSSSSSSSRTVNIEATRFVPKVITINTNGNVTWVNMDSQPHKVVSGFLAPVSNPVITDPIGIEQNNTFTPAFKEANFGDTLRWINNRVSLFVLEILDDSGALVTTIQLLPGQIGSFNAFPTAGRYTYRQQNFAPFSGTLILYGIPNPDGQFQSQTLQPGGSFTRPFPITGSYSYYDLNETFPNKSFATGTINVQ